MLYEQSIRRNPAALADRAPLTMMSTDVERILTGLRFVHELWAAPLEVAIAVWLLERQLSVAGVVPVVVALGAFLCPPSPQPSFPASSNARSLLIL